MFFCHWATSLQCVSSSPWSGNRPSCWPEASLFLPRHLSFDFRHLALLRPLLTAQSCSSVFWSVPNITVFSVQTRPNFRLNNSRGVISVPFRNLKLDIIIFRSWDNIASSLAYFFCRVPDINFANKGVPEHWMECIQFWSQNSRCFDIALHVTKKFSCLWSLLLVARLQNTACEENVFGYVG